MSERVTTEEIEKMILLYDKYGNYARVGREMGRAASTVSSLIVLFLVVFSCFSVWLLPTFRTFPGRGIS